MPIIDPAKEPFPSFGEIVTRTTYGSSGEVKQALTDLRDIGKFVARIIADKRTLNRYVLVHSEEHTQNEMFALAKRVSGKDITIKTQNAEYLTKLADESDGLHQILFQYIHSMFVRGDNTVENAKKEEYGNALDAKALYPDIEVTSLEAYAAEYYKD